MEVSGETGHSHQDLLAPLGPQQSQLWFLHLAQQHPMSYLHFDPSHTEHLVDILLPKTILKS